MLIHFIFAFHDLQNLVPGSRFFIMFWSVKTHLHAKDDTLKPVNIYLLFFTKKLRTLGI